MSTFKPAFYVNVTERCNMKCEYCPAYGENWESTEGLLELRKLLEIVNLAAEIGLESFRISGGEPFIFPDRVFAVIRTLNGHGISDIIVNSNGFNLYKHAETLAAHAINKLKISLDTIDERLFKDITNSGMFAEVMRSIETALSYGILTELNIVLYKRNREAFWPLLKFCEERELGLKVLDLVYYDQLVRKDIDPARFWEEQYLSLSVLHEELMARYGSPRIVRLSNDRGIPMLQYEMSNGRHLILKDGIFGSTFGRLCRGCSHFPCQEGLFHLSLAAGGNLTPCRLRRDVTVDLSQRNSEGIRTALVAALDAYEEITFVERTVTFPQLCQTPNERKVESNDGVKEYSRKSD